ncbi:MAG TPA: phosphate signaling complex protein PhoU [Anaerolineales bacterium]|nr:phosphate signaling complex protein PhoU [Anaerolineales bacterium]HLO32631.1 phosphate signaling complex protein PhoU [Anaerolineales bacterium]
MSHKISSRETQEIKNEVLLLSSMVEEAIMDSVRALKDHDLDLSHQILQNDLSVNRRRFEIEISIIVLMATQQPIARDLRTLAASLDVCTELERMGDYAKGIANINLRSGGLSLPGILSDIYSMAEKAVNMLHRAMTTFADEDIQAATAIIHEDDVIDECYARLYAKAVNLVLRDTTNIERTNYVIWAAHNLERLGDRATNVCERVIYIVTGELPGEFLVPAGSELSPHKS